MIEKSKYSPQKLNKNDKKVISKIIINFLVKYQLIFDKYPTPKKYATKEGDKLLRSDKDFFKILAINFINENLKDKPFRPKDVKNFLSNKLSQYHSIVSEQIVSQAENFTSDIGSTALNEKILDKFKNSEILYNYQGKKQYKKYFRSNRGKKTLDKQDDGDYVYEGGKRSIYFVARDIEQLKTTLKKPNSIEYLYNELIKYEDTRKIIKYTMTTAFLISKIYMSKILQVFTQVSMAINREITQKDIDGIFVFMQILKTTNDEQIELIADKATNEVLKEKEFFYKLVPFFGFIKLFE